MLWPAAIVAVAVVMCTPLVTSLLPQQPVIPGYNVTFYGSWFMKVFPLAHLFEFVVGILMARIVLTGRWINVGFAPAAILAVCDYYVVVKVPMFYSFAAAGIIPLALLVAAAAEADRRGTATWGLRSRAMVKLGEISFAFYMVHWLVLHYGHRIIGPVETWSTPAAFGLWAVGFVVALIAAWLLHEGVEMPVMRQWSRPKAARTAISGEPAEKVAVAARREQPELNLD
jgi:peptidoglycan/LPS O-acetylase OafA/YrhL